MTNPTGRLLGFAAAAALILAACSPFQAPSPGNEQPAMPNPRKVDKKAATYANPFPAGSYEHFVASREYPNTLKEYANNALLKQAGRKETFVVICLPEQRGRLYVDRKVALDWPVSTGVSSHPTPAGAFKVLSKEVDHHSSRYGTFRNAEGRVVDGNADILKESVPEGCTFKPSPMPYWQRLTGDGVGIHIGKVRAGRRLSHGCIRSPRSSAEKLYAATRIGTPVYITGSVESPRGDVDPADLKRVYKPAALPARKKPAPQRVEPRSEVAPSTPADPATPATLPTPATSGPSPSPSPALPEASAPAPIPSGPPEAPPGPILTAPPVMQSEAAAPGTGPAAS